jgi:hypothetical protein
MRRNMLNYSTLEDQGGGYAANWIVTLAESNDPVWAHGMTQTLAAVMIVGKFFHNLA